MLVVAVGVEGLDTKEVKAALPERKADAHPNSALGLEVQRKPALRYHILRQVRHSLLAGLLFSDDEVANGNVLLLAVRVGIGENEL